MRVVTTGVSQAVLILAPVGRDADVAVSVLQTAGIVAQPCQSLSELSERLQAEGNAVGALLLTEESLSSPMEYASLTEWLEHQEPWSELPIIFLTHPGQQTRVTGQRSQVLSLHVSTPVLTCCVLVQFCSRSEAAAVSGGKLSMNFLLALLQGRLLPVVGSRLEREADV